MWRQKEQDLCVRKSSVEKGPENVLRERSFSATVLTAHWRLQTADFLREESEGESDVCWRRKEDQCARGSRADGRGGSPLSTHSLIIRTHAGVPLFPLSVPHLPLPNFPTHTLSHTHNSTPSRHQPAPPLCFWDCGNRSARECSPVWTALAGGGNHRAQSSVACCWTHCARPLAGH